MLDRLPHYCPVCAYHEWNLDGLVEMIWEYLNLIRVYTKPKVTSPWPLGVAVAMRAWAHVFGGEETGFSLFRRLTG